MGEPAPLLIGGVMRCCIETWRQIAPPDGMAKDGDTMRCKWCSTGLVLRNGEWQWPGPDFVWPADDRRDPKAQP